MLGYVLVCLWAAVPADSTQEDPLGLRQHHRDLSLDELTIEAAKHGMEVIPPEEWMESRRRLQYTGGLSFPQRAGPSLVRLRLVPVFRSEYV